MTGNRAEPRSRRRNPLRRRRSRSPREAAPGRRGGAVAARGGAGRAPLPETPPTRLPSPGCRSSPARRPRLLDDSAESDRGASRGRRRSDAMSPRRAGRATARRIRSPNALATGRSPGTEHDRLTDHTPATLGRADVDAEALARHRSEQLDEHSDQHLLRVLEQPGEERADRPTVEHIGAPRTGRRRRRNEGVVAVALIQRLRVVSHRRASRSGHRRARA